MLQYVGKAAPRKPGHAHRPDGEIDGMQDFDSVIMKLIQDEVVTLDDGLSYATNQNNLLLH